MQWALCPARIVAVVFLYLYSCMSRRCTVQCGDANSINLLEQYERSIGLVEILPGHLINKSRPMPGPDAEEKRLTDLLGISVRPRVTDMTAGELLDELSGVDLTTEIAIAKDAPREVGLLIAFLSWMKPRTKRAKKRSRS